VHHHSWRKFFFSFKIHMLIMKAQTFQKHKKETVEFPQMPSVHQRHPASIIQMSCHIGWAGLCCHVHHWDFAQSRGSIWRDPHLLATRLLPSIRTTGALEWNPSDSFKSISSWWRLTITERHFERTRDSVH
jgi:hypothetical protein